MGGVGVETHEIPNVVVGTAPEEQLCELRALVTRAEHERGVASFVLKCPKVPNFRVTDRGHHNRSSSAAGHTADIASPLRTCRSTFAPPAHSNAPIAQSPARTNPCHQPHALNTTNNTMSSDGHRLRRRRHNRTVRDAPTARRHGKQPTTEQAHARAHAPTMAAFINGVRSWSSARFGFAPVHNNTTIAVADGAPARCTTRGSLPLHQPETDAVVCVVDLPTHPPPPTSHFPPPHTIDQQVAHDIPKAVFSRNIQGRPKALQAPTQRHRGCSGAPRQPRTTYNRIDPSHSRSQSPRGACATRIRTMPLFMRKCDITTSLPGPGG